MHQDTLNAPNYWQFSLIYLLSDRVQLLSIFSLFKRVPVELNEDELRYVIKLVEDSVEYQTESSRVYHGVVILLIFLMSSLHFILSMNMLGILFGIFLFIASFYFDSVLSRSFYLINRAKTCRTELNMVRRKYQLDEENGVDDSYYECEYEDLVDSLDVIETKRDIKQGNDSITKWEEVKKELNLYKRANHCIAMEF